MNFEQLCSLQRVVWPFLFCFNAFGMDDLISIECIIQTYVYNI